MNTIELPKLSPAAVEGLRALLTIIESGLAAAPPPPVAPRRNVLEVGNEFLVSKARIGKSVRYLLDLRTQWTIIFSGRMTRAVHTIATEDLEKWIGNGKVAPRTKRNRIRAAQALFNFARRRAYTSSNPADAVDLPDLEEKPVEIMPPADIATLLNIAREFDPNVMRLFAIQFFAGLRTSEAHRLEESEIGERYIEVKAAKCKTRRRRLVTISPTLRAWLDVGGRLPVVDPWKWTRVVKRKAGVPFPTNAARHSFCSYHLAHFGNAAQTAIQAGHSETMLFRHYREMVTPEAAAEFWQIKPGKEDGEKIQC
ncbi:MAG TPA: hypothetical protein VFY06_15590 [Verrucomicrobiae bacterium]|nr:hypothetical protein [Verrucomicrobiae bacterium]